MKVIGLIEAMELLKVLEARKQGIYGAAEVEWSGKSDGV